jgi:adenine phosphoribosyltransferase
VSSSEPGAADAIGRPAAWSAAGRVGSGQDQAAGQVAPPAGGAGSGRDQAAGQVAADNGRAEVAKLLLSLIRDVPDYPQPGVVFKDITPLLADGEAFSKAVAALAVGHDRIDKVAGIEARGFILAAPVACLLGVGFVPVRKQGKLPAARRSQTYQLEYGTATLEVHEDAFAPGDQVLIVDDVLATGGTAAATADLIRRSGAVVAAAAVMLELGFLGGRTRLADLDVRSLLVV